MRNRGLQILLCPLAAFALAAGLTACGDEDPNPAQERQEAQAKANAEVKAHNAEVMEEYRERNAAAAPSEEEKQGRESATQVYKGLDGVVGAWFVKPTANVEAGLEAAQGNEALTQICELMSDEAQAQTIDYAKVSSGITDIEWTCEKAMALLVRRAHVNGAAKEIRAAKILTVNAQGDRATATVSYGKGAPLGTIPLVREDGEWKLAASPASSAR